MQSRTFNGGNTRIDTWSRIIVNQPNFSFLTKPKPTRYWTSPWDLGWPQRVFGRHKVSRRQTEIWQDTQEPQDCALKFSDSTDQCFISWSTCCTSSCSIHGCVHNKWCASFHNEKRIQTSDNESLRTSHWQNSPRSGSVEEAGFESSLLSSSLEELSSLSSSLVSLYSMAASWDSGSFAWTSAEPSNTTAPTSESTPSEETFVQPAKSWFIEARSSRSSLCHMRLTTLIQRLREDILWGRSHCHSRGNHTRSRPIGLEATLSNVFQNLVKVPHSRRDGCIV